MKKIAFLLVLFVLVTITINAQKFGVKAGLNLANISNISNNEDVRTEMRLGFQIGGIVEFEISDKLSFQPELLYSVQGGKYSYEVMGIKTSGTEELNYINVPVMLKYYVIRNLSVLAGPQMGLLVSAKHNYAISGAEAGLGINGSEEDNIKDEIKSMDLGLNFGVGYKYNRNLFFDARYNLGFSDVVKKREDGDSEKSTNSVFSLTIGYAFD